MLVWIFILCQLHAKVNKQQYADIVNSKQGPVNYFCILCPHQATLSNQYGH